MNFMDTSDQGLIDLVRQMRDLQQRAALHYKPLVDDILRTGSRDARHIQHTLDGLLDFCDHEPVLIMYKALCRHYLRIDPAGTTYYVEAYRERWDSEGPEGAAA